MILNVCVIGNSMKSELLVTERPMIESRKLPHRRNMSKGISIVNGEHVVVDSGSVVRQVNLVAAFHDHISCTKSSEGCEENPSEKMTLPCQTDHIYANCADGKSADDMDLERLRGIVLVHTDLLQHQQEHIFKKDRQLQQLRADRDTLKQRLERLEKQLGAKDHMVCTASQTEAQDSQPTNQPAGHPVNPPAGHPVSQPASQPASQPTSQPTSQPASRVSSPQPQPVQCTSPVQQHKR